MVEDHPGYVIMSEALIEEWLDNRHEAYIARVERAMEDVAAGRVTRYESVEAMMEAIHQYRDDDE